MAVHTTRTEGVLEIVLDNGARGNPINFVWADEFLAAVQSVTEADRCVLLRAEGKNFCFGGDISEFSGNDPGADIGRLAGALHEGLMVLDKVEVPIVVAVQGWATGAGMSLVLAGDIVLASSGARFKTAYNGLGFTADGGMTHHLPRTIPRAVAYDLLFTDRVLSATEAVSLGMVSRVLDGDDLESPARDLALDVASKSRGSAVAVKRLLRQSATTTKFDQLNAERAELAAAADSPDGREGVAAFSERRPANFTHAIRPPAAP